MNETMDYEAFKYYLGETIEYCQTIEQDVKLMYSAMRKGDTNENYNFIMKWTLGKTLNKLRSLDNLNGPYFSESDYKLLFSINKERNYLCHNIYRTFYI